MFGKGRTPRNFLHVFIGYFIGGGLVLNGQLYTGPTGNAAAIGPLPIPTGDGGTRPLLEIASLSVLESVLIENGHSAASLWDGPDNWSVDPQVRNHWIGEAARGLAFSTAAACSILDIEAVLIDGWLPDRVRRDLVAETRSALAGFDLTGVEAPEVREGTIGPDARSLGAASLPLSERYLVDVNASLNVG